MVKELQTQAEEHQLEEGEEQQAKYVLSVGKRRSRSAPVNCLHRRDGCYRGKNLTFACYEMVSDPSACLYDSICKSCWPLGAPVFAEKYAEAQDSEDEGASTSSSASSDLQET